MLLISIALVLLMTVAGLAASPDIPYEDVVLLNNGGIVVGRILKQGTGGNLQIEKSDGIVVDIPRKKIAEITTTYADYQTRHRQILDSIVAKRPPEWTLRRLGIWRIGGGGGGRAMYGGSGTVAVEAIKGLYVGVGGGYDRHSDGQFLPMTGEVGLLLSPGNPRLFLVAKGGYAIGWLNDRAGANYGGARFETGFALGYSVRDDASLWGEISYVQQQINFLGSPVKTFDLVSLKFGIQFGKML